MSAVSSATHEESSASPPKEIKFYKRQAPYYEFSNFADYPITHNGKTYGTNEHFFQAHKFDDAELHEKVRLAKGPGGAFKLGRNPGYKSKLRSDWDQYRLEVMLTAVRLKFEQHDELKSLLLKTGNAIIIEDSPVDSYWGVGVNGNGKNHLGIILMKVREELASKQ